MDVLHQHLIIIWNSEGNGAIENSDASISPNDVRNADAKAGHGHSHSQPPMQASLEGSDELHHSSCQTWLVQDVATHVEEQIRLTHSRFKVSLSFWDCHFTRCSKGWPSAWKATPTTCGCCSRPWRHINWLSPFALAWKCPSRASAWRCTLVTCSPFAQQHL